MKKDNKTSKIKARHISFGSGKRTMVIVPGLSVGYVTDNARAIEDGFSAFTDEYTVHLFDIRDDAPENYTIRDMGEDLVSEIKAAGLDHLCLFGCSLGGMECIYIAGKYPALVEKAVIASSACIATETSDTVLGNWITLAQAGKYHELTDNMGKLIYSRRIYEASRDALSEMADGITPELSARFINSAKVIPHMDLSEEVSAIKCPVLVLGSGGDKVFGAEASVRIAEATGGDIFLYGEEYPHAVYDEAPDFLARVKAFFDDPQGKKPAELTEDELSQVTGGGLLSGSDVVRSYQQQLLRNFAGNNK